MNECNVSYHRKVYYRYDATDELAYQPTFEYLETLLEFSQVLEGKLALQDASTFMHYFNMTGTATSTTAMPKFVFFSAHAETIAPILHAFEAPLVLNPDPASMVLVNFYAVQQACEADSEDCNEEQIQVEIKYVPHLRVSEEIETIAEMPVTDF